MLYEDANGKPWAGTGFVVVRNAAIAVVLNMTSCRFWSSIDDNECDFLVMTAMHVVTTEDGTYASPCQYGKVIVRFFYDEPQSRAKHIDCEVTDYVWNSPFELGEQCKNGELDFVALKVKKPADESARGRINSIKPMMLEKESDYETSGKRNCANFKINLTY